MYMYLMYIVYMCIYVHVHASPLTCSFKYKSTLVLQYVVLQRRCTMCLLTLADPYCHGCIVLNYLYKLYVITVCVGNMHMHNRTYCLHVRYMYI